MLEYKDLDPRKKGFILDLDNVLYPERDYVLQVYYLFSNFMEFTTGISGKDLTSFFQKRYDHHGAEGIFDRASEAFGIEEKYRENFERLHRTAILPVKLLIYKEILALLQDIVVDRKQIFLVTNGAPDIQLNKLRQVEWQGLEKYVRVYYANEIKPKPETDVLTYILSEHDLLRKDILIIGNTDVDEQFAEACGTDYINVQKFI